jgi:hypothetical protein
LCPLSEVLLPRRCLGGRTDKCGAVADSR